MKKVIDISEHNGSIDFAKVKMSGITDVIIRIGWLGNKNNHTLDKMFKTNYAKAKYYGFNIGFYVYSYCKNNEALRSGTLWTFNQIKDLKFNLPVFLDLEDKTIENIGKVNLTNHAIYFCNYMMNKNFKAGVYASLYWFNNKLNSKDLLEYNLWLAEWTNKKNHSFKYNVYLWQYTDTGNVSGIKGNVDISKLIEEKETEKIKTKDFEKPKTYKNGSTKEPVYSDSNLSNQIGSLNPKETCECLGIVNNRYIVKYKIDNSNNYKVGFVKYSGGIK